MAKSSKVGVAKSIVFANCEIPKDDPSSVDLKTVFKSGEKICFRAFFEKTFGEYVVDEKATAYAIRFYLDGEKYQYFAGMVWKITPDQHSWIGFQDDVHGESQKAFDLLKRGKHSIEARVYMHVVNPTKQYQVTASGAGLNIRDASGTMDGSLVATGSFTFENTNAAPDLGVDLSKVDPKLKEAMELLKSKDFMQRLNAADSLKSFASTKDFTVVYSVLRDMLVKEGPGPVYSSLMRTIEAANNAGFDVSDLVPFLVAKLPDTSRFLSDLVYKNPSKKALVKAELEKANVKPTSMEVANLLNDVNQ